MLTLNHVSKTFQSNLVLEDISLTFENGVYGLLSPNGAGKTTLLKMITTLLFPTSGEILWNGQAIKELGADYRGILGYLPQDFGYYGNYTPTKFLLYIAALQKMNKKEAKEKIDELLELVALADVKNKKMKRFSGGMIQRVGIAQAMLNNPKLLILDEPTAGLDPKERVRFRNLIHRLAQDRIVILSTHIVSDVETIAKQIIMIKNHHLYCCETPAQITQSVQGKIFEVPATYQLTQAQLLLSERESNEGHLLRIASPFAPKEGLEVRPSLEDAFLYIYRDEVATDAFTDTPFEVRKLLEQPMILLFFIASLLLNTIYIATAGLDQSYLNYVQDTEVKTGTLMTAEFREKLSNESTSREQQRLLTETAEQENIFQHYSTEALGQEMIDVFQIQGSVAEKMKRKYEKLTPVVHELAEEQAALEVGAAGETMGFFTFIRNRLFRVILGESLIFALLLGLYGSTSERLTKTDVLVMTSKTGRKIQVSKYIASLMLTFLFYVTMVMLTFGIFNQMYDLGTLWQTSMSTQFHVNVYFPQMLEIPFIPWQPMTLLTYTILSIVVGGLLIILCHGFNFLVGLWTDHLFRGFIVFVVIYVSLLGLEQIINQMGWWKLHALLMWHPISLWKVQGYWFTEMGPYATIPWQESIAMGVNLLLLGVGGMLTSKFYATKEVK